MPVLQARVQAGSLTRDNVSSLLDYTPQLLGDNNYKVCVYAAGWRLGVGVGFGARRRCCRDVRATACLDLSHARMHAQHHTPQHTTTNARSR
jgi:hypothetical protein